MSDESHLSRIETLWSMVARAHAPQDAQFSAAQRELLNRYGGAVRRYALAALRDADAADEVFQEFALRFIRGDLGSANPERGKFRHFLKTTLYHLIVDYQRRRNRQHHQAGQLHSGLPEPARSQTAPLAADDAAFIASWRDTLLERTWGALLGEQNSTGKPYHTALRLRAAEPELRSPELAERLSQELGKPITAGSIRVTLHRARERFGEILLAEISQSLDNPSRDALQQELIDLDLWQYCKPLFEAMKEEN